MKKRMAAVQKENKALKESVESLKKSLKMTNAQELTAEVKMFSEECVRLRGMIENQEKQEDREGAEEVGRVTKEQAETVTKLRAENGELNRRLKKVLEEVEQWKNKTESLENSNKKAKSLKDQLESLKNFDKSKEQAEELERTKAQLVSQRKEYEKRISDLEQRLAGSTKLPQAKPEESKKTEKIIGKEAIKDTAIELRLNLILSNVQQSELRTVLNEYAKDKISIKDLTAVFKSSPSSLKADKAHKLARYLVEPRTTKEIVYDEMLDKKVTEVLEGLSSVIGNYTLSHNNNPEAIQESLLEKVNEKLQSFAETLQESADDNGYITLSTFQTICNDMQLQLLQEEFDYILLTMYKQTRDLSKLPYELFVEHLSELLNKLLEHDEESVHESARELPAEEASPELDEEQVLALVQRCFTDIAEQIVSRGVSASSVFGEGVYRKVIEGEEVELISPEGFAKSMRKLGVKEFKPLENAYLNKMLAASEEEPGYKVKDIVQILNDYGVSGENEHEEEQTGDNLDSNDNPESQQKNSPQHKDNEEEEVNIEDLDKVSMVLLLALSEYLNNTNSSLEKVFENVVYKQPVQIDEEELEIDIINSKDFFETINGIGIETEEEQHENLKAFLCLDPSYSDKFSLDKLKMAIEEFKTNEDLRECAKQYYQELVDADQVQEDNEE
eukprot:TRINITY_DN4578_c0_g1_i1.p1 TRINITY_DN4578_c0_g1~~TRINITY_DN4578_c0_g1_i1.p1  ORF type:complete len:673 (+),score=254.13 TRINITY_DN4578_c0_g1_i1:637-2655(+)